MTPVTGDTGIPGITPLQRAGALADMYSCMLVAQKLMSGKRVKLGLQVNHPGTLQSSYLCRGAW